MVRQTVTKQMRFEAAHRLINDYPGKCAHNHGHSWFVYITLSLKSRAGLDQYGFVKDFGDFKPIRKWIDDTLDHATIISTGDKIFATYLVENKQKHFAVTGNPTSETLCAVIFDKASSMLNNDRVFVSSVRVDETCTSESVYSIEESDL